MNTADFKTKSEIIERKMPRINGNNQYKGRTIIALDGGYSSVKGVSPNRVFCFPAYAKKAPKTLDIISKVRSTDIQFRNNTTGEVWLVGQSAESLMTQEDIDSTTDISLYTRYRYDSPIYKVIMATGMALGLWGTSNDNEIFLQTGLPAAYKRCDTPRLKAALIGNYDISIKVGSGKWTDFVFSLDEDHIDVMEQPQGTLCAVAYNNGEVSEIGKSVLVSDTIILDIGFGTEDIFTIRKGYSDSSRTFSDTGMRAVLDGVIKELQDAYPVEYKIFELQTYLEEGQAPYFDPDEFKTHYIGFADVLDETNKSLCEKSIRRLMQEYNNLLGYKYLIVTGGTGESRFAQIKEMLSGIPHLRILAGNLNTEDLSFMYSNVVGYYMFRHAKTAAELKKAGN